MLGICIYTDGFEEQIIDYSDNPFIFTTESNRKFKYIRQPLDLAAIPNLTTKLSNELCFAEFDHKHEEWFETNEIEKVILN